MWASNVDIGGANAEVDLYGYARGTVQSFEEHEWQDVPVVLPGETASHVRAEEMTAEELVAVLAGHVNDGGLQ